MQYLQKILMVGKASTSGLQYHLKSKHDISLQKTSAAEIGNLLIY